MGLAYNDQEQYLTYLSKNQSKKQDQLYFGKVKTQTQYAKTSPRPRLSESQFWSWFDHHQQILYRLVMSYEHHIRIILLITRKVRLTFLFSIIFACIIFYNSMFINGEPLRRVVLGLEKNQNPQLTIRCFSTDNFFYNRHLLQ